MKTIEELEISILKERLSKAVLFEVTDSISIGISESDDRFRIRRIESSGEIYFLNKNYQWEKQTRLVDIDYSERTGYNTASEAFDVLETVQELNNTLILSKISKNN